MVLVADSIWLIGLFGAAEMNVIPYSKKSSCMFLPFFARFICSLEKLGGLLLGCMSLEDIARSLEHCIYLPIGCWMFYKIPGGGL